MAKRSRLDADRLGEVEAAIAHYGEAKSAEVAERMGHRLIDVLELARWFAECACRPAPERDQAALRAYASGFAHTSRRLARSGAPVESLGPLAPAFDGGEDTELDDGLDRAVGRIDDASSTHVDPDAPTVRRVLPRPPMHPAEGALPIPLAVYAEVQASLASAHRPAAEVWIRAGVESPARAQAIDLAFRRHFEQFPAERRRLLGLIQAARRRPR